MLQAEHRGTSNESEDDEARLAHGYGSGEHSEARLAHDSEHAHVYGDSMSFPTHVRDLKAASAEANEAASSPVYDINDRLPTHVRDLKEAAADAWGYQAS